MPIIFVNNLFNIVHYNEYIVRQQHENQKEQPLEKSVAFKNISELIMEYKEEKRLT